MGTLFPIYEHLRDFVKCIFTILSQIQHENNFYKCQLSVKILAFCQFSVKFKAFCELSVKWLLMISYETPLYIFDAKFSFKDTYNVTKIND